MGAFAICPQLEGYAHDLHLRPVLPKPAPEIGNLVHAGLAYRYAAMLPTRPEWFVYENGYEAIAELGKKRPEYAETAARIFAAYEQFYAVNVWVPILVEHQFVVTFGNGEPYSARTDLLAWEWNPLLGAYEIVLIDHKTVGRITNTIRLRYSADRQMMTGLALARANGYNVSRVVINAISREMPSPECRRFDIPINPEAFGRLGEDTTYYLERMKAVRLTHPDPRNRPRNWDGCKTPFNDGLCDYFGLCTGTGGDHEFVVPEDHLHGRLKKGT